MKCLLRFIANILIFKFVTNTLLLFVNGVNYSETTEDLYSSHVTYHEDCGYLSRPHLIQDITSLLKRSLRVDGACIYNPGILQLSEDKGYMLLAARLYWSRYEGLSCKRAKEPGGQWFEMWQGRRQGYALAVLQHKPGQQGLVMQKVLSHFVVNNSNFEDARFFRDANGKIRMMFNRVFPPVETGHIKVQVSEVVVDPDSLKISLRNEQDLINLHQGRHDKNWVPWEGTSFMTYTNYPSFAPHTVMDWVDYDKPRVQLKTCCNLSSTVP
ncbi:hypothetical protein CEUSTIGMA_g5606.t1 [Chlamydomonas eustigma]|uniref:Uncharacterized protein n=1 Tax=Chlamydomonas eustigma TaxID=1157962 RepID=A0A250X504_9CHLO|nr:hypothetical protein CEUSTIGMA_g5606.t1 [Chlamydomonas eustigma]|eukprot:GAX78164.1 hypothetical protein CEUSTIGMA_g5606.t1 [Chlamydomonas eustigma]